MLRKSISIAILPLFAFGVTACDVQKTQEGNLSMPKYEVAKKQDGDVTVPKYKVETPDVAVKTEEKTIDVPTIKKEEKTIEVPRVEVTPAKDK
jgi:hypothetical protein